MTTVWKVVQIEEWNQKFSWSQDKSYHMVFYFQWQHRQLKRKITVESDMTGSKSLIVALAENVRQNENLWVGNRLKNFWYNTEQRYWSIILYHEHVSMHICSKCEIGVKRKLALSWRMMGFISRNFRNGRCMLNHTEHSQASHLCCIDLHLHGKRSLTITEKLEKQRA